MTNLLALPCYDGRKSFYGKAKVLYTDSPASAILYSYDTAVLQLDFTDDNKPVVTRLWDGYSVTTMRHVYSFLVWARMGGWMLPAHAGCKKWWNAQPVGVPVVYPRQWL